MDAKINRLVATFIYIIRFVVSAQQSSEKFFVMGASFYDEAKYNLMVA